MIVPTCMVVLAAISLAVLGGCRHHEEFVRDAHERYEQSRSMRDGGERTVRTARARPARTASSTRATRPARTARVRSRGRAAPVRTAEAASSARYRLHPKTPYVGSDEWKIEQAQDARREQDISRKIKSICGRC